MGFNLDGTWTSDFYPITDKDNDVPISSEKFQTLIQSNLKPSFENCITRDGTGKPIADISFMSHKITNLGSGTISTDAVNKGQLDAAVSVQATESVQGTAKIATEAETLAQSNDTNIVTPKKLGAALGGIAFSARFAINKGNAGTDGLPDLLDGIGTGSISFKVDGGTEYGPIIGVNAFGGAFSFSSLPDTDISGLANGEYNILLKNNDGTPEIAVYPNKIYRQANQPSAMNNNDIWYDTRQPHAAKIKTSTDLIDTTFIPLPQTITIASGQISAINIRGAFNYDGIGYFPIKEYYETINISSVIYPKLWYSIRLQYDSTTYKIKEWCEQGGYLSSNASSITLHREYKDTGYIIQGFRGLGSRLGGEAYGFDTKTSTGIYNLKYCFGNEGQNAYWLAGTVWEAKGYLN